MSSRIGVYMLLVLLYYQIFSTYGHPYEIETNTLLSWKKKLTGLPKNWKGSDPCKRKSEWVGISCNNSRIVGISLTNFNLKGKFPHDILSITELEILDLTSNPNLTGTLPPYIGNLKKLTILHLMGCGLSGQIPASIGNLEQLARLSLNSNQFNGTIPASIGWLSKLDWLDITDNQIEGNIPVSDGTSPGLDMLLLAKHFHFGKNKLSGDIPEKLFSSNMSLIHVIFDGNQFTGKIPNSLSLVKTLQVLRLDRNRLIGDIPSNLNNLTDLQELYLADNILTGSLPDLTSLRSLYTLDVSNNPFTFSTFPSWIPSLSKLSTLRMEGNNLIGPLPDYLFGHGLKTLVLKSNWINGTLNLDTFIYPLDFVDLQYNKITNLGPNRKGSKILILADNPVCPEVGNKPDEYCKVVKQNSTYFYPPRKCKHCGHGMEPNPSSCHCVYPLKGTFTFRSPSFSGLSDNDTLRMLWDGLTNFFMNDTLVKANVAIRNIREDEIDHHLLIDVWLFPLKNTRFDWSEVDRVVTRFSTQTYKPPDRFGPYVFEAVVYSEESSKTGIIAAILGSVCFLILLTIAGIHALRQKKRLERANDQINPFAKWDMSQSNVDAPQLMATKAFTFEEMRKYTNNFCQANDVGGGGYGQVYKGILPSGKLIAIKRAQPGSLQGALEFKTEIELLSRVHHKNVVRLLGFCFDKGEQMLVYEYIPNGSLRDSLSGENDIKLDWTRRLRIALGSGKGLAYLHELADPPIIHRDIKTSNILLDENLTAKVADFGLSQLVEEAEKAHITAQVKGTMGYLDPEYYMTNQLTEKSDVYGFGVVMLELITGKIPIVNGKYIVKEVKMMMDKSKNMYGLQELLDTSINVTSENLKGFEKYVDLALRCVAQEGENRPSMYDVVKEIENIMQHAGLNPNVDSAANSRTYEDASNGSGDLYGNNSFEYSASFPTAKLEPH